MQTTHTSLSWKPDALAVGGLDVSIGGKKLIINSDIEISRGQRIALLGRNGCGKTTFFNWLGGQRGPWSVYTVEQEIAATAKSVVSVVLAAHLERGRLWDRRADLESRNEDMTDDELKEYRAVCEELNAMKADADSAHAKKILAGLGFSSAEMDAPVASFSGGWRARVALAAGLFMEPDLLLLDEPTNHLDLNAVLWLGEFARTWRKTLVVITHNTGFAHTIANAIFHIDNCRLHVYKCSYNKFLKQCAQTATKAQKDWDALEKEVAKLKAKGTPKDKKAAQELLEKRMAAGIVKPPKPYEPKLLFGDRVISERATALIEIKDAVGAYGSKTVLSDVNLALFPGARTVLLGANGSGKSTLLKMLTEDLAPRDGVVKTRVGVRVRYFNQHFFHDLPDEMTPVTYCASKIGGGTGAEPRIRKLLGASGLEGAAHVRPISTLSGGQKARVYFVGLILEEPDVLLLDEPTNHLDMETAEALKLALAEFPGALLLVSHDLDFLSSLGQEVWVCRGGHVEKYGDIDSLNDYVSSVLEAVEL